MAQAPVPSPRPPTADAAAPAALRLEARVANGRPTAYEVGDGGFLVGSVPGCDLRVPGANLAPVLCLVTRQAGGAALRKLAPVLPVLLNGQPVHTAALADGDRIAVGPLELTVRLEAAPAAPPPAADDLARRLQEQERELRAARGHLAERERVVRQEEQDLTRQCRQAEARLAGTGPPGEELAGLRHALEQERQQLRQRYRQARDRLIIQQQAVRRAARRVLERKRDCDAQAAEVEARQQDCARLRAEVEARAEEARQERQAAEERERQLTDRQHDFERDQAQRLRDLQTRERQLADERAALEKGQKEHREDLARLDRLQAVVEKKQKALEAQALEVDRRFEQLQRDSRELEDQAAGLDEWHQRLTAEAELLAARKKELDETTGRAGQRAAALEGQQAMLATLRTRLERAREELRRQEQLLGEQRAAQEGREEELREQLDAARRLRAELVNDREAHEQERRRFEERRATLEAAVAQLRKAQESLAAEEEQLRLRQQEVEAASSGQAEQTALLQARTAQMEELRAQVAAERLGLREREAALAKSEQALAALQEQLRRRAEDLNERRRALEGQAEALQTRAAAVEEQARAAGEAHRQAEEQAERARREADELRAALEARGAELGRREGELHAHSQELEEARRALNGERQELAAGRAGWEAERQAAAREVEQARAVLEALRGETAGVAEGLPGLETRAAAALERLERARGQLREHLAEVHAYARQGREDLEAARSQACAEAEEVRRQRDEHRLAVAAFRQQLIDWQARVGEMKSVLRQGESELDRRRAAVDEQAQQVEATSARLARAAEELQAQQRLVAEKRGEMDRHLADMREWYRRKLRELSGIDNPDADGAPPDARAVVVPLPAAAADGTPPRDGAEEDGAGQGILALGGETDAADRQLGQLLHSLELVDADTMAALLLEARRQRRSLRQLLLAGNYLTLYQMALIEAGNLDALVLGPVRVIDRLRATPHEAVYRVFDPRRNAEALLRHLAEGEMLDAVRPDEFRQRFAATAAVRHVHVAATLEVLEVAGRPAVLQEWLTGLPSGDWPALAAAPGVWFRLLSQAAVALHAAHSAGLPHGRLGPASFVCTAEGVLKLCGLGEPDWLAGPAQERAEAPADDLAGLGRVAAGWATPAGPRKGKAQALPAPLQAVLRRLLAERLDERYPSAAALLEDLDRVSAAVPANAAAWERFVRAVREHAAPAALRQSA